MINNKVIAEAMTAVLSTVPTHLRESVAKVLTNIATAQYQAGYGDGMKHATELVSEAVSA